MMGMDFGRESETEWRRFPIEKTVAQIERSALPRQPALVVQARNAADQM